MITSDLQEITIDGLNPFEGDPSCLLTENPQGLWKKIEFDPTITVSATTALTLDNDKIVLTNVSGGGGGNVELVGAVTGLGPVGSPITTSLGEILEIDTNLERFNLNSIFDSTFEYVIQDAAPTMFTNRVSKLTDWVENNADFSNSPTFSVKTSDSANFNWNEQQLVSLIDDNNKIYQGLGGNSFGEAISVWTDDPPGGNEFVQASVYDPISNTWGIIQTLNPTQGPDGSTNCVVDMSENGSGVALWVNDSGEIYSSSYSQVTQIWSSPVMVTTQTPSFDPHIVLNANGDGIALWTVSLVGGDQLFASIYENGSWSTPAVVSPVQDSFERPAVEVDNTLRGLVTYQYKATPASNGIIHASRHVSGNTWGSLGDISNPLDDTFEPDLTMDPTSGNAICTFTKNVPASNARTVQFTTYSSATNSWSAEGDVSDLIADNLFFAPFIDMDPQGNAICVWSGLDVPNNDITYYGSSYDGLGWSPQEILYNPLGTQIGGIADFQVKLNNDGNGLFVWSNDDDSITSISYHGDTNTWDSPFTVAAPLELASLTLGLSVSNSNAVLTWLVRDRAPAPDDFYVDSALAVFDNFVFTADARKVTTAQNPIMCVGTPIEPQDAATKQYVDTQIANLLFKVQTLEQINKRKVDKLSAKSKNNQIKRIQQLIGKTQSITKQKKGRK